MFKEILSHPQIEISLGTNYVKGNRRHCTQHTIYTGPVDAFFDFQFGKLPYRSIRFEHLHYKETELFQKVGTVNFPNEELYTRITEFKHATGQRSSGTSIVREFPTNAGDPYYPIPRAENEALYQKYRALAEAERDVTFVGRLAQYRYYNMDQVVAASLKCAAEIWARLINT